jgi:hypothetical protein
VISAAKFRDLTLLNLPAKITVIYITFVTYYTSKKVKVKQSHYRAGQALRVPGD